MNKNDDSEDANEDLDQTVLSFEELLNQSLEVEEKEALHKFFNIKHDHKNGVLMSLNKESIEMLKLNSKDALKLKTEFTNQFNTTNDL